MDEFKVVIPNAKLAHEFYYKYIYQENLELDYLCSHYNFESKAPYSWKWEIFGAMLVGDRKKVAVNNEHKGADLANHEIKSSKDTGAFEYQYHLDSWKEKIQEDSKVTHIYISYSNNYRDVVVRSLPGSKLKEQLDEWAAELQFYWKDDTNQRISNKRFRKQIPYERVRSEGKIICTIKDSDLIYFDRFGIPGNVLLKPNKK